MAQTTKAPYEDIQYRVKDNWLPIPDWAKRLSLLGSSLHTIALNSDEKAVIALALPLRDWAATFLALGYLLGERRISYADQSAERHFRQLLELPFGKPVRLLHRDCYYDAEIRSKIGDSIEVLFKKSDRSTRRIRSSATLLTVTKANCQKVILIEPEQFQGVAARGRTVSERPDFLAALLPDGDVHGHSLGSKVTYMIVGDVGRIREEVLSPVMCREKEGCLQDVLRIRNFSKPTQVHCGLVKASMSRPTGETTDEPVGIVIHDSAAAYIRHHSTLKSPIEVILLDRSERAFAQAAQDISTRFTSRLERKLENLPLHISDGVESIAFLEARRK